MISADQAQISYPLGVGGGRGWLFGGWYGPGTSLFIHRALLMGNDLQTHMEFCKRLFLSGHDLSKKQQLNFELKGQLFPIKRECKD
jgi:hypothetical protein